MIRLSNIGAVYSAWGQYEKALEYFEQALTQNQQLQRKTGIAINLSNIGAIYHTLTEYDKAISYYVQAIELNRELARCRHCNQPQQYRRSVYVRGKHEDVLKAYEQALALDQAAVENAGIAGDLNNIGLVYKTWGKYDEALKYLEQVDLINAAAVNRAWLCV